MKRFIVLVVAVLVATALVLAGCAQPAPAPAPSPTPAPAPAPAPAPKPAPAEKFNLRFSAQWPEQSVNFKNMYKLVLDEIEQKSNGRITFTLFLGGVLGGGAQQYDIVRTGKADIATTTAGYTPGRFPITDVLSLPGAFDNTYDQHKMVLNVADRILKQEYTDTRLLSMQLSDGFWIYTKKQIKSLEDMKGLKIRSGGGLVTPTLEALGAVAVSMPLGDVYLSVQTGVVDGFTAGPSGPLGFKLNEVVSHELKFIVGWMTDIWVMNLDTWNKLPPDLQKVVEEASRKGGLYQVDTNQKISTVQMAKLLIDKGGSSSPLSQNEEARWIKALKPVVDKWVADMESKGTPAKKALDVVREEAKKLNVPFPY